MKEVEDFRCIKIKVDSEQESAAVQKYLFSKGCEWSYHGKNVAYTEKPFLFVDNTFQISYCESETWFDSVKYREVEIGLTVALFETKQETVEILGKKYFKKDVQKIIQTITEAE